MQRMASFVVFVVVGLVVYVGCVGYWVWRRWFL